MKKIVDVSLKSRYPLLEKRRDTMEVKRIDTADVEIKQQKMTIWIY